MLLISKRFFWTYYTGSTSILIRTPLSPLLVLIFDLISKMLALACLINAVFLSNLTKNSWIYCPLILAIIGVAGPKTVGQDWFDLGLNWMIYRHSNSRVACSSICGFLCFKTIFIILKNGAYLKILVIHFCIIKCFTLIFNKYLVRGDLRSDSEFALGPVYVFGRVYHSPSDQLENPFCRSIIWVIRIWSADKMPTKFTFSKSGLSIPSVFLPIYHFSKFKCLKNTLVSNCFYRI